VVERRTRQRIHVLLWSPVVRIDEKDLGEDFVWADWLWLGDFLVRGGSTEFWQRTCTDLLPLICLPVYCCFGSDDFLLIYCCKLLLLISLLLYCC
jgi:hypothetical protein